MMPVSELNRISTDIYHRAHKDCYRQQKTLQTAKGIVLYSANEQDRNSNRLTTQQQPTALHNCLCFQLLCLVCRTPRLLPLIRLPRHNTILEHSCCLQPRAVNCLCPQQQCLASSVPRLLPPQPGGYLFRLPSCNNPITFHDMCEGGRTGRHHHDVDGG